MTTFTLFLIFYWIFAAIVSISYSYESTTAYDSMDYLIRWVGGTMAGGIIFPYLIGKIIYKNL